MASRIFLLGLALVLSSCKSAPIAKSTPGTPGQPKVVVPTAAPIEVAPSISKSFVARAITSQGANFSPRFSPDGAKILFISSGRPSHRQAQVYELDLVRMTERRVTFHDGDDHGATYLPGGQKIAYSSDTDELKEDVTLDHLRTVYEAARANNTNPNGIRPVQKKEGGDIYVQRLDGRDIERLTKEPTRETSPTGSGSTKIVYSSNRDRNDRLYLFDGHATRAISHGGDLQPMFSNDGKTLAWVRSLKPETSQIFVSDDLRSAVPLTSPGYRDQSPSWNAKGDAVVFTSNRGASSARTDIFLIDRKGSCLKRLTEVQGELSSPAVSPDGSKIAFAALVSGQGSGQNQIYVMENRADSLPCQPLPR